MYVNHRRRSTIVSLACCAALLAGCGSSGDQENDGDTESQTSTPSSTQSAAPSTMVSVENGLAGAVKDESVAERSFDPEVDAKGNMTWEDVAIGYANVLGNQSKLGDQFLSAARPYVTDSYYGELERIRPNVSGIPLNVYAIEELTSKKIVKIEYPAAQVVYIDLVMPVTGKWLVNAHEATGIPPVVPPEAVDFD